MAVKKVFVLSVTTKKGKVIQNINNSHWEAMRELDIIQDTYGKDVDYSINMRRA